jgi:hypothetical protein
MEREQAIRELAYAIWESNGRPDGCAEAHWHQAEARIDADAARTKSTGGVQKIVPGKTSKESFGRRPKGKR